MWNNYGFVYPQIGTLSGNQVAVTTTSASFTFSQSTPTNVNPNILNYPEALGNLYYICVDGATVGISQASNTYANSVMKIPPGAYLASPIWFPPQATIWLITAAGTATIGFVKAYKVG